ncbi:hypothetical protein ATCC53582_00552 [Novacetimonas hansenii]|nr:hypothetical protein CFR74_11670 [Novacetimonas hansenii]RFP05186.1 hypothetical protein BGC30_02645 [Novacetimonas hansenii]CUW46458.1 hypothetical protein ATCC53582_00552 [Novacetimonas hansenii]
MLYRLAVMPVSCRTALPVCVVLASSMFWLGGCTLVGQKTFNRHAGDPPRVVIPPPPPVEVRHVPPLLEIRAGTPPQQWQPDLKTAVAEALARKPNVLFTIVTAIPDALSPDEQASLLSRLVATDAQSVAAEVVHDGAAPAQMEMTGMTDPGVDAPMIRLYVR